VAGQGGYFDIVPDPDFATNALVYLSFAHGEPKKNALRVVRAKLDGNTLTGVTPIFTVVPWKDTPHHYGGRMAFLSDGTLLITTGEGFTYREASQTLDNHFGKVVRIRTDGGVPADNPFIGSDGARPEVWTFGHRNPQAVVVVPGSGTVYLHEHGPRGGDELNLIVPGRNYGWPAITYGIDYSGATVSPYTELPGMEQPLVYWVPSIAPAGMAWYDGALFPDWRGNLLIASLAERTIRRVELRNGSVIAQHVIFDDLGERFRDVRVGPDGAVYLLTDSPSGRVLKVTPRE
jgi:glucose/arabinose dehydrogenase